MISNKSTYDSSTKVWSGGKKEPGLLNEYSCVGEAIFENLRNNPDSVFQISETDGKSIKNEEILKISIRIAQQLEIEDESIIGIMATSSPYQACILLAAWFRGIIFHPISSTFDKKTTRHVFGITRPKVVFCDENNYDILIAACNDIDLRPKIYTVRGKIDGVECLDDLMKPTGKEDDFRPKKCKQDDTCVIMGSSGTTGLPKGVCLSHKAVLSFMIPLPNEIVAFAYCNVDWITGLIFLLFSSLYCVTRIVTEKEFSPKFMRELIEKYKINVLMMSGSGMSRFIKSGEADLCDCSSLKMFAVGGGNVSHPMYVKMNECIREGVLLNTYGGTEFGGVAAGLNIEKPKSVGQLYPGVKVRIVDDDGENLEVNESGEILVWNENHWNGYYNNPIETKNMYDSQGWFHTGDIGFFDEDGDLHLVDRKKEIMKYRGFHYSAQEIENCILALEGIAEVCVFGTRVDEYEDLATAAVVRKVDSKINENDIKDHVKNELLEAMWLHGGVYFVESIPKTPSGKYQRNKIRDICLKGRIF